MLSDALAESLANGDLRFAAQAMTAGAVMGRNPATAPMPTANDGV